MQLVFHDVKRSQWVEDYIAERARRLERFASDITSCRVTLAQEQASQHKGNRYSVLVEVHVPPQQHLAVCKQKDILDMPQQLPALINHAFGAIERQLKRAVELRRHEGYGFIRTLDDNRQFYFHRNSVLHGDFERLAVGSEVRFAPEEGDKGPQASSVQLVAPAPSS
jgi:cold shock CspA family protein